jgi:hypothetical protein
MKGLGYLKSQYEGGVSGEPPEETPLWIYRLLRGVEAGIGLSCAFVGTWNGLVQGSFGDYRFIVPDAQARLVGWALLALGIVLVAHAVVWWRRGPQPSGEWM